MRSSVTCKISQGKRAYQEDREVHFRIEKPGLRGWLLAVMDDELTSAQVEVDVVPCEARRGACDRFELTAQPPPTVVREVGVAEPVQEELRFIVETPGIDRLIDGDGHLPLRGIDERVDEPVDEPVDVATHLQAEPYVAFRRVHDGVLRPDSGAKR